MGDQDKIETRYHYEFIHNVFGHFIKDTLDYFSNYLYPRFGMWSIISTYDKAVQYMLESDKMGREPDQPLKPALILNPSGDLDFDETYGKMFYRYPNLAPGMAKYVFDPIYQDQNVLITLGWSRMKGEIEFMALLSSFYEYFDFKVFLGLIFGGKDRYIFPEYFNSFMILPPEIYNYNYSNPYTGVNYNINIPEVTETLIKTTNKNEYIYPLRILPRYKLTSVTDASERYGGIDKLPAWKLNFSIEYEVEIPSYVILESDYLAKNLNINIGYGSCYSQNSIYNSLTVSDEIDVIKSSQVYVDSTSGQQLNLDSTGSVILNNGPILNNIDDIEHLVFKTRYFHIVTQDEADSTTTVSFQLPEIITNINELIIYGKNGPLNYGDHYTISIDGLTLNINKTYVSLGVGDIIELYVYGV